MDYATLAHRQKPSEVSKAPVSDRGFAHTLLGRIDKR
jgi:hypothetical protein